MNTKKQLNDDMLEKVTGGAMSDYEYGKMSRYIEEFIAIEDVAKAYEILERYKNMKSVNFARLKFEFSKLKQRAHSSGEGGASGSF